MPCRMIEPEVETLVQNHPDVLFITIDLGQDGHEVCGSRALERAREPDLDSRATLASPCDSSPPRSNLNTLSTLRSGVT